MFRKSLLLICVGLVFVFMLNPPTAFAHKMIIEQSDDGLINVRYDDGTAAGLAIVSAYDQDGELLFERHVDDDGNLEYDEGLDVYRFTADDSMGHRATLAMDDEQTGEASIPTFIKALLGVSIFVFIAAVFTFRGRRKTDEVS